jgi:hypothetical protein
MKLFEKRLHKACYSLAEELNWSGNDFTAEQEKEHAAKTAALAESFVLIAEKLYIFILELEKSEAILIGAIRYLQGQMTSTTPDIYLWFENTLATLLRICSHELPVSVEDFSFLTSLQKGILNAMQEALEKEPQRKISLTR